MTSKPMQPIELTLPRPWEAETTFNDVLYEWMDRAPWLAISAAAHVLALFIAAAFIQQRTPAPEAPVLQASFEQTPEELLDEPEEELIEDVPEVVEPLEEPIPRDVEVAEKNEMDANQPFDGLPSDADSSSDLPFTGDGENGVLGVGGGAGGGGPRGGGYVDTMAGEPKLATTFTEAFLWLSAHQASDGSWDSDGFTDECGSIGDSICTGAGKPQHDVGVTGLALLAFLGAGNTTARGPYREQVAQGVNWLRGVQDPDTGLIGDKSNHEFLYDHAIATIALCEAYGAHGNPLLKGPAQQAINYILRARNYGSAWRYTEPGNGENDTSVTGWMIFALKAAEHANLVIDRDAYAGATSWFDEVTDKTNGRVGYSERGGLSSRVPGVNDQYPAQAGEGMTAVALLSRIFMGETAESNPMLEKHADLLLEKLPEWDPDGLGNDMYYWYYGTYAMYQMAGKHWRKWEATILSEVVENQSKRGDERGSWDPNGPWGHAGGRVYSTAMLVLSAEVYFRYPNVTGAR